MALSAWEKQQLRSIEASLVDQDPQWSGKFATWGERTGRRVFTRRVCWIVVLAAWVAMLAAGVALESAALVTAALAVVIYAPMTALIVRTLRR